MNATEIKKPYELQGFIELSPNKRKRRTQGTPGDGSKENMSVNFEIMNIPIRTEKPFRKIPKFNESEIVIKSNARSQRDL